MDETITCTVENIIYSNDDNGYTVCDVWHNDELVCAVGFMPCICEGDSLTLRGKWTVHHDYGEQFKVEYYEKTMPVEKEAMVKYLGSGLIHGIRSRLAQKIVDEFGADTFTVIEQSPEKLKKIPGISLKKAYEIGDSFREQHAVQEITIFLNQYGMSPQYALKIYKKFDQGAMDRIRENPYVLCDSELGIDFKKADKIALDLSFTKDNPCRIYEGIKYILSYNCLNGHCYLPYDILISSCVKALGTTQEQIENSVAELSKNSEIVEEETPEGVCVYLHDVYFSELNAARRLIALNCAENKKTENPGQIAKDIEDSLDITFEEKQRLALREAMSRNVLVITGGPGTGKTTVIKAIIDAYGKMGLKVGLCAPTGRAAKRMSQLCGLEAKTIHRLLEVNHLSDDLLTRFEKNDRNPLEYDCIIVDEMSMVDIFLFDSLLSALKPGTRLILVGDADQLPSVGAGNVLADVIESGFIKVIRFDEIKRQARESLIVVNAHKINRGEYPDLTVKDRDFFFMKCYQPQKICDTICSLCKERLPKTYDVHDIFSIQVLSPTKKGFAGTRNLNAVLQEALNPPSDDKNEKQGFNRIFRVGDKVMQIRNNYDLEWQDILTLEKGSGVYNGDIGLITDISAASRQVQVLYDEERLVKYDFMQLDELELAYALTVHKSQGSEFDIVVMPMTSAPPMLLTRNLFYTAITRAKKLLVLVGNETIVQKMVDANYHSKRYSGLIFKMKELMQDA